MTISFRSDAGGTSGALQINGVDRLTLNSNGSVKGAPVIRSFRNLKLSATGLNGLTSITADELILSADDGTYLSASSVNVNVSIATAGAGGLDSGLIGGSTWYSVWAISNGTTVAGLLSLSSTAPTMPPGYLHKMRVGWIRTDSTANKFPLAFTQTGSCVQYKVASGSNLTGLPAMASGVQGSGAAGATSFTWAAISTNSFFPTTARVAKVLARAANTQSLALGPNSSYGGDGNASNPPYFCVRGTGASSFLSSFVTEVLLETNAIYVWSDGATNGFYAVGWEDNL